MALGTLLLIISFVLALLAACGVAAGRVGLFPLAFAIYVLAGLVAGVHLAG